MNQITGTAVAGTASSFPIVGVGASAGGLAAFAAFFSGMPADVDPGMAFVLVQHLDPDHASILTELIRRYTRMPVCEVEDGMVVRINCVYVIPPTHDMALISGALQLQEPSLPRGLRLPINHLFNSLAQDQHQWSIGIVLSGTGSDGTLGVQSIHAAGGMVMAQTLESCDFDGMPRSAIGTGFVDYQLAPEAMAARLIRYVAQTFGKLTVLSSQPTPVVASALRKILLALRAQTGHDFAGYKPSTLHRRIERRMAVHYIDAVDVYVRRLQQSPEEVDALFRDLLIGVTNFFRDPEAFQALAEQVIPKIFERKPAGGVVRVWSCGCCTGEEAYSIAMLLQEHMDTLDQGYSVQIFATDLDDRAIAVARTGLYSANIAGDVSPERLARFFTLEPNGRSYRIQSGIRDMVVFSEQNLVKDPPFSKLDLISCRNLLIYLGAELQLKVMSLFHFALNPGGGLFLGTSEGIDEGGLLFTTTDRNAKLYQTTSHARGSLGAVLGRFAPTKALKPLELPFAPRVPATPKKMPLRELTENALLLQIAPAGALVNGKGDIMYLHGRSGMYFELAAGEAGVNNVLKMAREGLQLALAQALRKAVSGNEVVRAPGLRVKTNGHFTWTNLCIRPVPAAMGLQPDTLLYLVILEEASDPDQSRGPTTLLGADDLSRAEADAQIAELKAELESKDDSLLQAEEKLNAYSEELKSASEEMQASNEELQSLNEELFTLNGELNTKVVGLSRVNNDMNNLLSGTGIATVFVDHDLRILRFTPTAAQIINLVENDVGRKVGHIVSNLVDYKDLLTDVQAVLDTLVPKDAQVQTTAGAWYTMRIRPYRTQDHVIEGAVLTFVDITEMKAIKDALEKANRLSRMAVVVMDAHDAITVQDLEGHTLAWNPGAERMYGWSEAEALQMNVRERIPLALRANAVTKVIRLSRAEVLEPYSTQRLTKGGAVLDVSMISTALLNETGQMYAVATTERPNDSTQSLPELESL
jgi:two-component system CheB/CheR fusion protein